MLKVLQILLILLTIFSVNNCTTIKPQDYVYEIHNGQACYYKTIQDLAQNKNIKCQEDFKDLEGWKVIHPTHLKELMMKAVEETTKNMYQQVPQDPDLKQ
jgi:hypothetical protein